jgi:hypothetical protein
VILENRRPWQPRRALLPAHLVNEADDGVAICTKEVAGRAPVGSG